MKQINLDGVLERFLKNAQNNEICPLADGGKRPKWKCGNFDRGGETFCKSIAGYSKCAHYTKWFYWNLWRIVAKEIAKLEFEEKKKNQKENTK